jgi:hypothetical protein
MTEQQVEVITEILLKRITFVDNAYQAKSMEALNAIAAAVNALVKLTEKK